MTPEQKMQLRAKIDLGVKASVARALEEHARAGRKVTIWQNGCAVHLVPPLKHGTEPMAAREEPPEA